jgi:hypothetical protein
VINNKIDLEIRLGLWLGLAVVFNQGCVVSSYGESMKKYIRLNGFR